MDVEWLSEEIAMPFVASKKLNKFRITEIRELWPVLKSHKNKILWHELFKACVNLIEDVDWNYDPMYGTSSNLPREKHLELVLKIGFILSSFFTEKRSADDFIEAFQKELVDVGLIDQ